MINLGAVSLRKFEPSDVDAMYEYRNSAETMSSLSRFSSGFSRAQLGKWLSWHEEQKDEVLLAIVDTQSDRAVGHVALYQIDHRIGKAELGILIGDPVWQARGLGQAICEAVLALAFNDLNLQRVWVEVLASNARSFGFFEKLGFLREGTLRNHELRDGAFVDCHVMSLLRSEWQKASGTPGA